LAAAALALGFAGCTTRPQVFHRIDGTVATPKQFAADKAICQGELDKAYLAKQRGLFAPDELRGVFAGIAPVDVEIEERRCSP
jgi:hypothetical protein